MQNEITELRNQVRTLKRIVYGFGCLLVAGIVVGATSLQTVPDVIQAKKFEVVDKNGKAVTTLDAKLMLNTPGSTVATVNGGYLVYNEKAEQLLQLQSNSPTAGTAGELVLMRANGTQFISLIWEAMSGQGLIQTKNDYNKLVSTLPSLNQRLIQACGPQMPYGSPPNPARVKYLIDSGAGINFEANNATYGSSTPLDVAVINLGNKKDTSVISMLLERGADPNKISNFPMPGGVIKLSPLMYIVSMNGDPAATQVLIKAGADVNAQGAYGSNTPYTPLMAAAQSIMGSPEIVSILLKAGADANVKTSKGKTALDFAKANPAMKGTKVIEELEAAMKQ